MAWSLLRQHREMDLLEIIHWNGLRYRFDEDVEAGERAVHLLEHEVIRLPVGGGLIEQAATLMAYAQAFEMLRDHPALRQPQLWLEQFREPVRGTSEPANSYVAALWANTLILVAGIVLEDETLFGQAVDQFQQVIRSDVHPEGYIRKAAADGESGASLSRMLLAAQALVLCAEAASHAGTDLWDFNLRGVSALTPLPYLLYYYYYPEKWRWDAEIEDDAVPEEGASMLDAETVKTLYQRHAGLWEMAQRRKASPDRQKLLEELRPVYDLWGGGLVTLSHGTPPARKKRFGLF
jgi:hypothetical protein